MKHIKIVRQGFIVFWAVVFLGQASAVSAKTEGCWGEFYDQPQYKGQHFRLEGKSQLSDLTTVQGENWDKRIESLIVGPNAQVTVFENKNFKLTLTEMANYPVLMKSLGITKQDILEDSEIILRQDSKVHSLSDFSFYHKIRSLKVECIKK